MARKKRIGTTGPARVADASPAPVSGRSNAFLQRLERALESRRAHWAVPLVVALLAFTLSAWTFDAKLSLSGDNTEFITLARSLAQGEGLTYVNQPQPRPATKYPFGFPLMLAPLAADETERAAPAMDWIAMKWLVVCLFAVSMAAVHMWLRVLLGAVPAAIGAALCATNPLLVEYSHQVMSEIPYVLFSALSLLALARAWPESGQSGSIKWSLLGFATIMWAYHVRSFGIVLVAALILFLLQRRNWRQALIVSAASAAAALPWILRNRAVGGGGFYIKQLFQVNPYQPELGYLDTAGFLSRLGDHVLWNLGQEIPAALVPHLAAGQAPQRLVAVALVGIGIYALVLCLRRRRFLLPVAYTALSLGLVFAWPWVDKRFLLPLVPLFVFFLLYAGCQLLERIPAAIGPPVVVAVLVLVLAANAAGLAQLRSASQAPHPPWWHNYYEAGLWLRNHGDPGQIVACRKPFWMHVVSGLPTIVYPFKAPAEAVETMHKRKVAYVVVDQLGFPQTQRFLVPAIGEHRQRFRGLWHAPSPDTYVLSFDALTREPAHPPE